MGVDDINKKSEDASFIRKLLSGGLQTEESEEAKYEKWEAL